MKCFITGLLILLLHTAAFTQGQLISELKVLFEDEEYKQLIDLHASKVENYPARAVFYVGMAYYMQENNPECLNMMNLSIDKDSKDPNPHYIKGIVLNQQGEYTKAIVSFKKAIKLYPENGEFYSGMGDSYLNLNNFEQALQTYQKACEQLEPSLRAYIKIGQIYEHQKSYDKAFTAFYKAKEKIASSSEFYPSLLYHLGETELLTKNYDNAEQSFKELLGIAPNDYQAIVKLIQIHYGRKEYDKATPLKEKLYQAHKEGNIDEELKDMFCIDQFEWKDKVIQVYETYEESEGGLYYKHLFYVLNQDEKLECRIQTENSPITSKLGGPKYLLGMNKENSHFTFNIGFEEDSKYEELKKGVLDILEGNLKPASMMSSGKK